MKCVLKDQKQKFINIIEEIQDCGAIGDGGMLYKACNNKQLAETLIANNAIVLPAKLGSKVFTIRYTCGDCKKHETYCDPLNCAEAFKKGEVYTKKFELEDVEYWGEYVFATKEEAEERSKNEEV